MGLTDLLVEPIAGQGLFEYYRDLAAAKAAKDVPAPKLAGTYAVGSVEWLEQRRRLG